MNAPDLLPMLRCPVTRQPLHQAPAELLARVAEGRLNEGLVREDGQVLYPISDGLPVLLPDAAIPLE